MMHGDLFHGPITFCMMKLLSSVWMLVMPKHGLVILKIQEVDIVKGELKISGVSTLEDEL